MKYQYWIYYELRCYYPRDIEWINKLMIYSPREWKWIRGRYRKYQFWNYDPKWKYELWCS
jgi:hypothetical protein